VDGVRLFSANVRDYLGARRSDSNINNGIMLTAKSEPENFWAYNNGITVLVNDFSLGQNSKLTVRGLSVVNGAQTTGALGSVNDPLSNAWVQARFIKTADQDIVSNVIRYNNSQNRVTAADFRSTDKLQKRLREEFALIPDAEYEGGRRGGSESVIRRRKNLLASFTVRTSDSFASWGARYGLQREDRDLGTRQSLHEVFQREHECGTSCLRLLTAP
jgi:hypothetical protein